MDAQVAERRICPLCLRRASLHDETTGACPPREVKPAKGLTQTQMRVLRFLLKNEDAYVRAVLNEGNSFARVDYSLGAAMFAKGENWVQRAGARKWAFPVGSKTLEALWPLYVDQRHEESGNERSFFLTERGMAAARDSGSRPEGENAEG